MGTLNVIGPSDGNASRPLSTPRMGIVWLASLVVSGACGGPLVAGEHETGTHQNPQAPAAVRGAALRDEAILPNVLYSKTLDSTCWIVVMLADGISTGTGWVVDAEERLLLTNHHVVIDSEHAVVDDDRVRVYFPEHQDGRLITDCARYIEEVEGLRGEVFDTDARRDLAVIRLESLPAGVGALPLAEASSSPGAMVCSIGNPSLAEALWVYTSGTVRQLYDLKVQAPWGPLEFRAVMTQSPTNPGDSGGPVVNRRGQLVGVSESWKTGARLISNCIDVSEVQDYMAEVRPLLKPGSAEDYNRRGVHYYYRKRYDRALLDFSQAIRLDKKLADAYGNRGWTFLKKDDPDSALGDFDEAIRLDPDDVGAYGGRGEAHLAKGAYAKAVADCTKAIRMDPKRAFSYHRRAAVYYQQGDYDRAIGDCNQAIRLDPEHDSFYNNRGRAYAGKGQYDRAIADYTRAIRLNPREAVYYGNRGHAYRHGGDYPRADADYAKMEEIDPEYADSKKKVFTRKYLKIANANSKSIRVYLIYRTYTTQDEWRWYPGPPDGAKQLAFTFHPGESSYVSHDGWRINADRIRIWAEDFEGEGSWTEFKDRDLVLVDGDGYRACSMRTHTFEFTP